MKKMKNDNKGFTLVELIVVLVILAILAAILVPALLGYIDEAKASQLELHGKSVYTAAQAVASKAYAKTKNNDIQTVDADKKWFKEEVAKISEMGSFNTKKTDVKAYITFKSDSKSTTSTADNRKYFTVDKVYYTEDGGTTKVYLADGAWNSYTGDWPSSGGIEITGSDDKTS